MSEPLLSTDTPAMPQRTGDGGALGVAGELDIVGRPETAIGPLHGPGLSVVEARGFLGSASSVLVFAVWAFVLQRPPPACAKLNEGCPGDPGLSPTHRGRAMKRSCRYSP